MPGASYALPVALAAAFLAGCEPTAPGPAISRVVVAPSAATVSAGEQVRFVATVSTTPSGSAYAVTWATSDTAAASVDSTGLAVGKAASSGFSICATASTGNANSTVTSCATLAVVVVPAPLCPGPEGSLIPSLDTMQVGGVAQFQIPAAQLAGRSPGEIRWTLNYPATASIDSLTGVVTAVSTGGTDVIATDPLPASPCPQRWHAILIVR